MAGYVGFGAHRLTTGSSLSCRQHSVDAKRRHRSDLYNVSSACGAKQKDHSRSSLCCHSVRLQPTDLLAGEKPGRAGRQEADGPGARCRGHDGNSGAVWPGRFAARAMGRIPYLPYSNYILRAIWALPKPTTVGQTDMAISGPEPYKIGETGDFVSWRHRRSAPMPGLGRRPIR
jgi:hypothetical protein